MSELHKFAKEHPEYGTKGGVKQNDHCLDHQEGCQHERVWNDCNESRPLLVARRTLQKGVHLHGRQPSCRVAHKDPCPDVQKPYVSRALLAENLPDNCDKNVNSWRRNKQNARDSKPNLQKFVVSSRRVFWPSGEEIASEGHYW